MKVILTNIKGLIMNLKIKRWYHDDCTIGRLSYGNFQCWTLELPMLDNATDVSCIYPAGGYNGSKHYSTKNGDVISINNVMDRTNIQLHSGNYCSQIRGCILVGDSVKFLNNDRIPDVTNSRNTLKALLKVLPNNFRIEIT